MADELDNTTDPLADPEVAAMVARMRLAGWRGPMRRDGTYPEALEHDDQPHGLVS